MTLFRLKSKGNLDFFQTFTCLTQILAFNKTNLYLQRFQSRLVKFTNKTGWKRPGFLTVRGGQNDVFHFPVNDRAPAFQNNILVIHSHPFPSCRGLLRDAGARCEGYLCLRDHQLQDHPGSINLEQSQVSFQMTLSFQPHATDKNRIMP